MYPLQRALENTEGYLPDSEASVFVQVTDVEQGEPTTLMLATKVKIMAS